MPNLNDIKIQNGKRYKYDKKNQWRQICNINNCMNRSSNSLGICTTHTVINNELKDKVRFVNNRRQRHNGKDWIWLCIIENCDKIVKKNKVCSKHLTYDETKKGIIKYENDREYVHTGFDFRLTCLVTGCLKNPASKDNCCFSHAKCDYNKKGELIIKNGIKKKYNGKKWEQLCSINNCNTRIQKNGVCSKHLDKDVSLKGNIKVQNNKKYIHDGKTWRQTCIIDECLKYSSTDKGYCFDHTEINYDIKDTIKIEDGIKQKHSGKIWKRVCYKCDSIAKKNGYCEFHSERNNELKDTYTEINNKLYRHNGNNYKPTCIIQSCTKFAKYKNGHCCNHALIDETLKGTKKKENNFTYIHTGKQWKKCCKNCFSYTSTQRATKKYDYYCSQCFKQLFPNDPRTPFIKTNSKELKVRDFINMHYDGFIHDKSLYTGNCNCTHRRRIDLRKIYKNTMLCIEIDENQHKRYSENDENIRYDDLYMIFSGKWVFIRYNPDKYMDKHGNKRNPQFQNRMERLNTEIYTQIDRINNEENKQLVEIIKLYYDEC